MDTGHILFGISVALICGLFSNRIIKLLHLPNVTGYLVVGILLGPYLFSMINPSLDGVINQHMVESFGIIVDVALGFIAFSIGGEFKLSSIKKLGKGIITITVLQATMALVFVDVALVVVCLINKSFSANLPFILTLGAVATATAPAATLMVIKQYKAKGPLTDTLLPVVAFDDAIGLILFSISFAVASVFAKQYAGVPGASVSIVSIVVLPLLEIIISLVIGGLIGFVLSKAMNFFKSRANRLMCMLASVLFATSLTMLMPEITNKLFHLEIEMSSLLTCMMVGAMFCNLRKDAIIILDGVERWTPALFMLFFILSGAELNFGIMANGMVIGICTVYLLARSLGKILGANVGCKFAKVDGNVRKYLGFTLLPQAGVAIGMARSSANSFRSLAASLDPASAGAVYLQDMAGMIVACVLCATLVYELVGPVITKIALTKANEIVVNKEK